MKITKFVLFHFAYFVVTMYLIRYNLVINNNYKSCSIFYK